MSKILHVPLSPLPVKPDIIQKIPVSRFFKGAMFIDTDDPLYKEGGEMFGRYVPIQFVTTFRTMYSNMVLERVSDSGLKYYVSLCVEDSPMFRQVTEVNVSDMYHYMSMVSLYKYMLPEALHEKRMEKVLGLAQLQLLGLYNPDPGVCNPLVVMRIVFPDDPTVDVLPMFLYEGCRMIPISEIRPEGNIRALIETFKEVKDVRKHEYHI